MNIACSGTGRSFLRTARQVVIAALLIGSGLPANGQQQTGAQQAAAQQQTQQPFPPLNQQQQAALDRVLLAWQAQSQQTKTLECDFERWHYDLLAAPAGVHASWARGIIKYAEPDRGLFRVDDLAFYKGMKDGKPQWGPTANKYGEYWICTGVELVDYNRDEKKCNVHVLPPAMQGQGIFDSPLPFVFNLDAQEIKQRYWVKLEDPPAPNVTMVTAWPKTQEDRAQYKVVQIALNARFEPMMLRMYAPNYHPKHAPQWDQYEFKSVKRNAIGAGLQNFIGNFIPKKPPQGWETTRQNFIPPKVAAGAAQAPAQR